MKVLAAFGTRPEAIKMCPVIIELRRRGCGVCVCLTGQHKEMLADVMNAFGVGADINLGVMRPGQTLFDINREVLSGMDRVLDAENPDVVLVHGDTTTTFAAALSAYYKRIKVGHVEAGLRTGDIFSPYPEEFNRRAVTIVADYNFAPTEAAKENLLREGVPAERVFVTGNTEIDALKTTVREDYAHPLLDWARGSRLVLMTAHRRENFGEPFANIFSAVRRAVEETPDVKLVYPVHLNPNVREAAKALEGCDRIKLTEPLGVLDFHNMLARCCLALTDSGGIQEDAPALNKPVLVLRRTTERPEGVATGALKLVGTDEAAVYAEFRRLLDDDAEYARMASAANPYGDGNAAARIADVLLS
ncbi:MAG: UDP-N-acetylglucosamine 2-epimerase (non-hydrolyzing) [Clostridia bacterium]|nr:UDP-N-acetylglucosamine 2-epimerase (non-hydrolyzing) [Clostridia bacterium]